MEKYSLLHQQLLFEGTATIDNFFEPEEISEEDACRVHTLEYWQKLENLELNAREVRKMGFPLSSALIKRDKIIAQGTIEAVQFALQNGISANIAGGTHHAYADHGEGFCLLNDQAIAAAYLLKHKKASQILIVDLDVHQGNGTASIFAEDNRVFTFSTHGKNNYPLHKEISDLDIAVPDGMDDDAYLHLLTQYLPASIEKVKPDFVFYLCGVDILRGDKLGRLAVSLQGCKERDAIVLEICHKREIPLVFSMGGGYSSSLRDIIEAHANTYRLAKSLYF